MTGTRSYLDHASLSPLRPEGLQAMTAALGDLGGDPGRQHTEGMQARVAVEVAREQVAALVGARSREVVFTASASEAIAAVCWGVAARGGTQVLSAVEHSAVRTAATRTGDAIVVGVDGLGRIDIEQLAAKIDDTTAVVHVQWSNHEVGTTQPIDEVVELCRSRKVLVHVDAAQGVGHDPIDFAGSGVDLLSLSGPKFGGPMGTGALVVRRGLRLAPLLVGGDQERARRAGLENVPACVALGAVAEHLAQPGVLAHERATALAQTTRLTEELCAIPGVIALGDRARRAPHLVLPAPQNRSSPRRCSKPWGSTLHIHCDCPWAGRRPTRTSPGRSRRFPWSWRNSARYGVDGPGATVEVVVAGVDDVDCARAAVNAGRRSWLTSPRMGAFAGSGSASISAR